MCLAKRAHWAAPEDQEEDAGEEEDGEEEDGEEEDASEEEDAGEEEEILYFGSFRCRIESSRTWSSQLVREEREKVNVAKGRRNFFF